MPPVGADATCLAMDLTEHIDYNVLRQSTVEQWLCLKLQRLLAQHELPDMLIIYSVSLRNADPFETP